MESPFPFIMRIYVLTVSIWFIFIIGNACDRRIEGGSPTENDLETFNLHGDVKKIEETTFSPGGKSFNLIEFSRQGNILIQSSFNNDSSLIRRWEYEYQNGNKSLRRCYVGNDSLSHTLKYYYNDAQRIDSVCMIRSNGEDGKINVCHYDTTGNLIKELNYDIEGKLESQYEHHYNDLHQLKASESHDFIFNTSLRQEFLYDDLGRKIKESNFSPSNNRLIKYTSIQYGSSDRPVRMATYNDRNEHMETTIYQYDENGHVEKIKTIDRKEVEESWDVKYWYDEHLNWKRMVTYVNNEVDVIIERNIEYFAH